ncbi:hypothetical protein jhhlp_007216 [Lomentospora prolificans]|uniref:Uncharacterized protein n=1 Tax=Lomentospora prolificans TaxID=41688 RepID=A0A2N3N213_9PEZI|nr:hypothetical protein jhhlp_007216 [Lomentospora prolificans]
MDTNPFAPLASTSQEPCSTSTQHPDAPSTASSVPDPGPSSKKTSKRRKDHRGGKKKRSRRKSFAPLPGDALGDDEHPTPPDAPRDGLYARRRSLSPSSLDDEAVLLNHRDLHQTPRSRTTPNIQAPTPFVRRNSRRRLSLSAETVDIDPDRWDERTPLMSTTAHLRRNDSAVGASAFDQAQHRRRNSASSSKMKPSAFNVNYPPSVPGTPTLGPSAGLDMSFGDVMIRDELARADSPTGLSLDDDLPETGEGGVPRSLSNKSRRNTGLFPAEDDVCFPAADLSEVAEEGESAYSSRSGSTTQLKPRRRRRGPWPDLSVLESWSRYEKEQETARVKKITEPQLINGRLRAVHKGWYLSEEDAPYRFTYFNEEVQSTIHSQSISGLVQAGGSFRELFIPDPRVLSDDESDSEEADSMEKMNPFASRVRRSSEPGEGARPTASRKLSMLTTQGNSDVLATSLGKDSIVSAPVASRLLQGTRSQTPSAASKHDSDESPAKGPKYGDRPIWWLDVLSPTESEMKIISQAFGIHPLTAEDIMVQEAREKVELFRNYYFVNYRTFDQDIHSENYMEPVNMYTVVFREGIISFHFSPTPHAANVRRRIRQLKDYLIVSSDWISYAIIDDITDVFGPIIQSIEEEVDDIDESIMDSWGTAVKKPEKDDEKNSDDGASTEVINTADVLRRAGDCRKRVMSLYRLLGNKADVIKGFAKRCNEQWEVTPHSDIGLYLGDIQDHILTMTSNLSHYEMILARAHGNYLAQINLKMTERSEQTADSLNKLTVLGTIVLPMNIITGLWGMNVWVPGQEYEGDLTWFVCITIGLFCFGFACYYAARRVYGLI